MLILNREILNGINDLRVKMFGLLPLRNEFQLPKNLNASFELYWLIDENVRCDLISITNFDVELDHFGFIVLRRNVRNSIEAYYDLVNLLYKEGYYDLLNYLEEKNREKRSGNYSENRNDCREEALKKAGFGKYLKYNYLPIYEKGHLAKKFMAKGTEKIWEDFENIIRNSNNIVHPNIFAPLLAPNEKEDMLRHLLTVECSLLYWSYMYILGQLGHQSNPYYINDVPNAYDTICKKLSTTQILVPTSPPPTPNFYYY